MLTKHINRRRFLMTTAKAAAVTIVPRGVLGGQGHIPPSEKLNIAGIGIGGMGGSNLRQLESENIVALCDVDHKYTAKTFKRYPKAKIYTDFRKMLDQQKDIDAVVIATPDHTHAVISMEAMRKRKHVYCQKPLTHDIYESRMLAKAAQESGHWNESDRPNISFNLPENFKKALNQNSKAKEFFEKLAATYQKHFLAWI